MCEYSITIPRLSVGSAFCIPLGAMLLVAEWPVNLQFPHPLFLADRCIARTGASNNSSLMSDPAPSRPLRWQIGARIAAMGVGAITWARWREEWPFQKRNLISYEIAILTGVALVIWWLFLSRSARRLRWQVMAGALGLLTLMVATVRLRGWSGDMVPVLEWRWSGTSALQASAIPSARVSKRLPGDFPQFYGPDRTGVLAGPKLASDWTRHPPQILWRKPIGAGWSGFVVLGDVCITQEQRGENECVSAFALSTGQPLWVHTDAARYQSLIAGEGPRATPTIAGNRVFTLGSTGLLNCLDLVAGCSGSCERQSAGMGSIELALNR